MSVRVIDTSGPLWQVMHDEEGHDGELDPSMLSYGTNVDGSVNREVVLIPCPLGDGVSYWPRETLATNVQEKLPA